MKRRQISRAIADVSEITAVLSRYDRDRLVCENKRFFDHLADKALSQLDFLQVELDFRLRPSRARARSVSSRRKRWSEWREHRRERRRLRKEEKAASEYKKHFGEPRLARPTTFVEGPPS